MKMDQEMIRKLGQRHGSLTLQISWIPIYVNSKIQFNHFHSIKDMTLKKFQTAFNKTLDNVHLQVAFYLYVKFKASPFFYFIGIL